MTSHQAPLTTRKLTDHIAYIHQEIKPLKGITGAITTLSFLRSVRHLATLLPDRKQHVINLCSNRYLFMLTLCASILRGHINLLPSNKNLATQKRLSERYSDHYIIHDGCEIVKDITSIDLSQVNLNTSITDTKMEIPLVDLDQIAAISFTSGSTGNAKPNVKTWRSFVASTAINSHYMLTACSQTQYLLATVPAQHMWGLETSVLMALFSDVCVADSKPLFPHDILHILEALPKPQMMVSTPVHLRALVHTDLDYPTLNSILCATSPLTRQLAIQAEERFNTELREVYGCSEIGSMAVRKTAHNDDWERFGEINFTRQKNQQIMASAQHLPAPAILGDFIDNIDERFFRLKGRTNDMIDIAGKRGSLNEINAVLLSFPDLIDGIVFFPPQDRPVPRLVAMVVLPSGIDKKQLSQHFRQYVDAAFVPRPIIHVKALPREENGKLPDKVLLDFYQNLPGN